MSPARGPAASPCLRKPGHRDLGRVWRSDWPGTCCVPVLCLGVHDFRRCISVSGKSYRKCAWPSVSLNVLSKEQPPPNTFADPAHESVPMERRFGKAAPDPAEGGVQPLSRGARRPGRAPRCEVREPPPPGRCLCLCLPELQAARSPHLISGEKEKGPELQPLDGHSCSVASQTCFRAVVPGVCPWPTCSPGEARHGSGCQAPSPCFVCPRTLSSCLVWDPEPLLLFLGPPQKHRTA